MRLLLTSDLHYKLRQYDWLMKRAPEFDVVVVAGDHVDAFGAVPSEVQIAALSATLAALARQGRVLVCSGNHDLDARSPEGEMTASWLAAMRASGVAVDGDSVEIGDMLFTICPWWDGPHARARAEALLDEQAQRRRDQWTWVYHAPPEGPLSWNGKRHYGDAVLAGLIARHGPTAVLCGHIHEAPFKSDGSWVDRVGATWVFNAGRQIGDVPARIEIDFDGLTARWISLAGVEERSLQ
jgi:Icc-related predicted phosphoesterase